MCTIYISICMYVFVLVVVATDIHCGSGELPRDIARIVRMDLTFCIGILLWACVKA